LNLRPAFEVFGDFRDFVKSIFTIFEKPVEFVVPAHAGEPHI
jgi:hypothetical protein